MLWFDGSIPDAISAAKQRSFVFVVVIAGDDDQSRQLMSSWEDAGVSGAAQRCCVAIRVDAKSDACVQFSQIYPVVCVPSSFFIGDNGVPLEVVAGSVSPEELMRRINKVRQMHALEAGGSSGRPLESREPPPAAAEPVGSAAEPEPAIVSTGSVRPSAEPTGSEPGPDGGENLEAKVERLTKKLEERREQRKKGEEENEVQKEAERRQLGRSLQDFRRRQEEEKTRRLLEERNRDKAEEKAARERVRQQIAMDRADRAARYAQTQEEEKAAQEALLQARQAEQEARREEQLRQRSSVARIQFRLPDGSSFTNQFPPQTRLRDARNFAAAEVGSRYGNFSLATMFPRREFGAADLDRTLLELQLVPSASIALLPSGRPSGAAVRPSGPGLWAALGSLLYPLLAVWRFLSSFLFAAPPSTSAPRTDPGSSRRSSDREKQQKEFQKDGNICRLRTPEDSEDDNNTWNGNSTQQM